MKTSYRFLRFITYILRVVGSITFVSSFTYFCYIIYLLEVDKQYISNAQELGINFYVIIIGAVLFLSGFVIAVLCDIADNSKRIAEKEWIIAPQVHDTRTDIAAPDYTKYMPK